MDEKILIPLDGSKVGEAALPYVEELLTKLSPQVKPEIILLQVLSQSTHPIVAGGEMAVIPYNEQEMEANKENALAYLIRTGEKLEAKGATVITKVAIGDASDEIIRLAEEININMIAMSTHGRGGLSRWAFGSVTDKVLRHGGKVPILVVKAAE